MNPHGGQQQQQQQQQQQEWGGAALRVTHASMAAWEPRAPLAARSAWAWDAAGGVLRVEAVVGLRQLLHLIAAAQHGSCCSRGQQEDGSGQQRTGPAARDASCSTGAGAEGGNPYLEVANALVEAALGGSDGNSEGSRSTSSSSGGGGGGGRGGGSGSGGAEGSSGGDAGDGTHRSPSSGSCRVELCIIVSAELLPALLPPHHVLRVPAASGMLLLEPLALPLGEWAAWRLSAPAAAPLPRLAYGCDGGSTAGAAALPCTREAPSGSQQQQQLHHHHQQQQQQDAEEDKEQAGKEEEGDFVIEESEVSDSPHPITLTQLPRLSGRAPSQQQDAAAQAMVGTVAAAATPAAGVRAPGNAPPALQEVGGDAAGATASSDGGSLAAAANAHPCLLQRRELVLRGSGGAAPLVDLAAVLVRDLGFRIWPGEGSEQQPNGAAEAEIETARRAAAAGTRARVVLRAPASGECSAPGGGGGGGTAAVELLLHGGGEGECVLQAASSGGSAGLDVLQAAMMRGLELSEQRRQGQGQGQQQQQEQEQEQQQRGGPSTDCGGGRISLQLNPASRASLAAAAAALDALDAALLLEARAIEGALKAAPPRSNGGAARGAGDAAATRDQRAVGTPALGKRGAEGAGGMVNLVPSGDAELDELWLACLQAQADLDSAIIHLAAA
jgi:hypothetical protein